MAKTKLFPPVYVVFPDKYLSLYSYPRFTHMTLDKALTKIKPDPKIEVGFDIETNGLLPRGYGANPEDYEEEFLPTYRSLNAQILLIQIFYKNESYLIHPSYIQHFKEHLETFILIGHNLKFDLYWIYNQGIYPTKVVDTMIQEKVRLNGLNVGFSLRDVVKRHLGIQLAKEDVQLFIGYEGDIIDHPDLEMALTYGANDIKHLPKLAEVQRKVVSKKMRKSFNFENKFVPVIAYLQHCGMHIDKQAWLRKYVLDVRDMLKKQKETLELLEEDLEPVYEITGNRIQERLDINLDSPKQVIEAFSRVGLNPVAENKKGELRASVDKKALASIKKTPKQKKLVGTYEEYKELSKVVSSYGMNYFDIIDRNDNRIRSHFNQFQHTGRLSSSNPVNFQNIPRPPRPERACFTPAPGNIFLVSDFSQQEQVILANKSKDPDLLAFFRSGESDMHSFIASKMEPSLEGLPLHVIKEEHGEIRYQAKTVGFALNYGGNARTIANNIGCSEKEGQRLVDAFFDAFPNVKNYMEKQAKVIWNNGKLVFHEKLGHHYLYSGHSDIVEKWENMDWDFYREQKQAETDLYKHTLKPQISHLAKQRATMSKRSLNYSIQSVGALMMKRAATHFFEYLRKADLLDKVLIPNIVHDEIVVECPRHLSKVLKPKLEKCMLEAGAYFCELVPCKADVVETMVWDH